MIQYFWVLYANSLLKQGSKSELILTISLCSAACAAVEGLEKNMQGWNSFDFQCFAPVTLQKKQKTKKKKQHIYIYMYMYI